MAKKQDDNQNCASISPGELEPLSTAQRIVFKKLDTGCKKHAEIILGLGKDWTLSDCKSKYRKLNLQYHPDKYKGEDANQITSNLYQARATLDC